MNDEIQGRMPARPPIRVKCKDSQEDTLRQMAQETLRAWAEVLEILDSTGDPRSFEANIIQAAARQFLAGGGGNE